MADKAAEIRFLRGLIQWINVWRAPDLAADVDRLQRALEALEASAPEAPDYSLSTLLATDKDLAQRVCVAHLSRCLAVVETETLRLEGEKAAGLPSNAQRVEEGQKLLMLLDVMERLVGRPTEGGSPPGGRAGPA